MKKSKLIKIELEKAALRVKEVQKKVTLELQNAADSVKELEETIRAVEAEEKADFDNVNEQINTICKDHNYFCGVILNPKDVLSIVELMFEKKGPIKVQFVLYPNEVD